MDYTSVYQPLADSLNVSIETVVVLMAIVSVWSLIWKGLALWKSCKKDSKAWFVVLLVINTVGILEILYIFLFSKIDLNKTTKKKSSKSSKKKKSR